MFDYQEYLKIVPPVKTRRIACKQTCYSDFDEYIFKIGDKQFVIYCHSNGTTDVYYRDHGKEVSFNQVNENTYFVNITENKVDKFYKLTLTQEYSLDDCNPGDEHGCGVAD